MSGSSVKVCPVHRECTLQICSGTIVVDTRYRMSHCIASVDRPLNAVLESARYVRYIVMNKSIPASGRARGRGPEAGGRGPKYVRYIGSGGRPRTLVGVDSHSRSGGRSRAKYVRFIGTCERWSRGRDVAVEFRVDLIPSFGPERQPGAKYVSNIVSKQPEPSFSRKHRLINEPRSRSRSLVQAKIGLIRVAWPTRSRRQDGPGTASGVPQERLLT